MTRRVFREGDYVTDGVRIGLVTSGFVSWVGGGTSPLTLKGLRHTSREEFARALGLSD